MTLKPALKYICIDIGNVICEVNLNHFIENVSKYTNKSYTDIFSFLERIQKHHDLGLSSLRDEVAKYFQIKSKLILDDLMNSWNKTVVINPLMLSWIINLLYPKDKSSPYQIALLSNIGLEHSNHIKKIIPKYVFDKTINFFSCEVGARKPTLLYYKTFLDMYPEFKNSLYLDDRSENIEIGIKFGFKSVKFALDSFHSTKELSAGINEIDKLLDI
jgi:FMN phosphatase YigB (HAD superfamily)